MYCEFWIKLEIIKITLDKTAKEEGIWKPECRFPFPSYGKKDQRYLM
jgi:hypothetical protein